MLKLNIKINKVKKNKHNKSLKQLRIIIKRNNKN